MGETPPDTTPAGRSPARRLARVVEPFHTVAYYCPEVRRFDEHGFKGWWHAYFCYRPAPMGPVPAEVVVATFYNFAPRMVERAVPGVWDLMSPADAIALQRENVDLSLRRLFGDECDGSEMAEAARLARTAVEGIDMVGRPIFAGLSGLTWPDEPHLQLWHAATLMREHRGDSHVAALVTAGLDGVECHVLMAAKGMGNRPTIEGIRGWTGDEWDAAVRRLAERGWVTPEGALTEQGDTERTAVERHTDALSSAPADRLTATQVDRLESLIGGYVGRLIDAGEISGHWPPPGVMRE